MDTETKVAVAKILFLTTINTDNPLIVEKVAAKIVKYQSVSFI